MLFEQQLQVEREKYGHVWPAAPLIYAELKTLLYDQRDGEQDDDAFFALLEKEVLRINRAFVNMANAALRNHRRRKFGADLPASGSSAICSRLLRVFSGSGDVKESDVPSLRACNEYVRMNTCAIRKILKKHDKIRHDTRGAEFWKSLWRDHTGDKSFLHSALRVRMDAAETMSTMFANQNSGHRFEDTGFETNNRLCKDDLMCPICLEPLYRPIALSCGHVYCFPCLMKACGLGRTVGTFRALMSNIDPNIPCCTCRECHVYRHAACVPELKTLVRRLYPAEYHERDKKERAAVAEMYNKLRERDQTRVTILGVNITDLFQ